MKQKNEKKRLFIYWLRRSRRKGKWYNNKKNGNMRQNEIADD